MISGQLQGVLESMKQDAYTSPNTGCILSQLINW